MITLRVLPSREHPIAKIKDYITEFYRGLGYKIDRIEMTERAFTKIHVLLFRPYLRNGKLARNLSLREKGKLALESWYDHYCLGSNPIMPLALQLANVAGEFMAETKAGIFMLDPEVTPEQYKTIIEMAETLRSRNIVLYRSPNPQDLLAAMEYLKLNGGNLISNYDPESFFVELPPHLDLGQLKRAVSRIRAGKLPLESFTGHWNILDPNPTLHALYERNVVLHAIAILAYKELVREFPYLGPSIYEVRVGNHFDIQAPISRAQERGQYEFYLNYLFENYPMENWSLIPYQGRRDLIVKRFAYEKRSPLVLVPKTPMAGDSWYAPDLILVYQLQETLDDDTLYDEQIELERLLQGEDVCVLPGGGCDIEKNICCISKKGKKIFPEDMGRLEEKGLIEGRNDLTPMEEERLLKMEFGLRGFFRLGGVLKGLFNDPPLADGVKGLRDGKNGKNGKIEKIERDIVLYMLRMEDGREIPILSEEEQRQIEAKRDLRFSHWTLALLSSK